MNHLEEEVAYFMSQGGVDPSSLQRFLTLKNFFAVVRTARGGAPGQSCFEALPHQYVVVLAFSGQELPHPAIVDVLFRSRPPCSVISCHTFEVPPSLLSNSF